MTPKPVAPPQAKPVADARPVLMPGVWAVLITVTPGVEMVDGYRVYTSPAAAEARAWERARAVPQDITEYRDRGHLILRGSSGLMYAVAQLHIVHATEPPTVVGDDGPEVAWERTGGHCHSAPGGWHYDLVTVGFAGWYVYGPPIPDGHRIAPVEANPATVRRRASELVIEHTIDPTDPAGGA